MRHRATSAAIRAGEWVLPVVLVIVVWWFITVALGLRSRVLPAPLDVAVAVQDILSGDAVVGPSTYVHMAATFARLMVAFIVSFVIGVGLGILAGRKPVVFDLLSSIVWVFLAIPSIVWVFVFVVAIGLGNVVPVAAMSALLIPLVLINVAEGAKAIPDELTEMAKGFHVGRRQLVTELYVPYLAPYLAGAARVSFALGVRIVMIVEVVGLSAGAGYLVNYWSQQTRVAPIVAWGVVFIVIGLLVDRLLFAPLERNMARKAGQETEHAPPQDTAVA